MQDTLLAAVDCLFFKKLKQLRLGVVREGPEFVSVPIVMLAILPLV